MFCIVSPCNNFYNNKFQRSTYYSLFLSILSFVTPLPLFTYLIRDGNVTEALFTLPVALDQVAFYRGYLETKSSMYYVEIYCYKNCSTVKLYKTQKMAANQVNFMKLI